VYVLEDVARTTAAQAQTFVIAASETPLDLDRLRKATAPGLSGERAVSVMPEDALEEWLREANPIVLTDDYAPADNLMAPIFLERGL
jgi:hypothetical protein